MIDALYARYSLAKEKPLDPSYRPDKAIVGRQLHNPHSDKLAVVFPGWHNHLNGFPTSQIVKRLIRKGWAVLVYDFHEQILEPDDDVVVESFRFIRDRIVDELKALTSHEEYVEVRFISVSMGGVIMGLVADKYPGFTSSTVVVGGDNLAIDMWYGLRTKRYAQEFQKLHIGVRKLAKEWDNLAPANHLRHFKDKPLKFVMGTRDKFVLTRYQKKLLDELIQAGAKVKVKKHHGGHVLTIALFALFDSLL